MRTAEQITQEIANLEGELAALAGEPLTITDEYGNEYRPVPNYGATVSVDSNVRESVAIDWYPTTEAAKARLAQLAREHGGCPDQGGFSVDLSPGCTVYVTRIEGT